jgi:hypothetical protein
MILIEKLAKKAFEDYCNKNKLKGYWSTLSTERKLVWISEIVDIYKLISNEIKDNIKPVANSKIGQASFEKGYQAGVKSERMKFIGQLLDVDNEIEKQIKEFTQREQNRQKKQR